MGIYTDAYLIVGLPLSEFTQQEKEKLRNNAEYEGDITIVSRYYDHDTDVGVAVSVTDDTAELMHRINTSKSLFQFITGKIGNVQVLPHIS